METIKMSLKRRAKIQQHPNSHSKILKQINDDIHKSQLIHSNHQQNIENQFIKKMEQKIFKIISAYEKLQKENKKKDQTIKQLEQENQLLKQRLVNINQQRQLSNTKIHNEIIKANKQHPQPHVIQRTFTPINSKYQYNHIDNDNKNSSHIDHKPSHNMETKNQHKKADRSFNFYNPTSSIVQQYTKPIHITKRYLKQSRSVENFNNRSCFNVNEKIQPNQNQIIQKNLYMPHQFAQYNQNNLLSKRDQNRVVFDGIEEDKSFMDVLGKLKDKIKKYDQEDAQNFNTYPNDAGQNSYNTQRLSKVKSSHNLSRKHINVLDSTYKEDQKKQMKALKQIWNQRDEQIKRMDQLFKNIDQRLNINKDQQQYASKAQ